MESPVRPGDTLLGKYKVERVLGMGGMGMVVAARHIQLGELFAIKFLLPAALKEEDALERFLREARAAARLKGEHVTKVVDVGQLENGAPYMVMEYLAGSDLKSLIDKHFKQKGIGFPVEEALLYVMQACDAIVEAHAAGIIHRDIKPANLFLVRRPNGTPCVKVLDFGISKHTGPEEVGLTKTGSMFGSPLYMSPEQMAQTKDVDGRTDVWSMGVVLYEFTTGVLPFPGRAVTEVVSKVLQHNPPPPSHVRPEIPVAVDEIVMRCLSKRPEGRFQSMSELLDAFRELLSEDWVKAAALGRADGALGLLNPARASMPSAPRISLDSLTPRESTAPKEAQVPQLLRQSTPDAMGAALSPVLPQSTDAPWGATAIRKQSSSAGKRAAVVGAVVGLLVLIFGLWIVLSGSAGSKSDSQTANAASSSAAKPEPSRILAEGSAASASSPAPPTAASTAPLAGASAGAISSQGTMDAGIAPGFPYRPLPKPAVSSKYRIE